MAARLYRFVPEATVAARGGAEPDEVVEVTWRVGRTTRLRVNLKRCMLDGLRALPPAFDARALRRAIGVRSVADRMFRNLVNARLLGLEPCGRCLVSVEAPGGSSLAAFTLPARHDGMRALDLLVGDDGSIATGFAAFAAQRPRGTLVSWVRLGLDEVEVGPLQPAGGAAPPPVRRDPPPALFPGALAARFAEVSGVLEALLRRALAAPGRHGPLAGRSARLDTRWTESASPYRVEPVRGPWARGVIRLTYANASVEGTLPGSGISPDSIEAAAIARFEAFERFALARPDLARPAPEAPRLPSLARERGIGFAYLRELVPLRRGAPALVVRPVTGGGGCRSVPLDWIYFGGKAQATNTNGAAIGPTLERAIVSAQRELVERDLFLRAWYGLRRSRELSPRETASTRTLGWRCAARERGLDVRWFLLGDAVGGPRGDATVLCLLVSRRPPFLSSGLATRRGLAAALDKSFLEAAGMHATRVDYIRRVGRRAFVRRGLEHLESDPKEVGLFNFGEYWAAREDAFAAVAPRFSRDALPAAPPLDPRRFLFADVTPPGLAEGIVVKVVHPDAAPLPNNLAHLRALERLLGVRRGGPPPPID